MYHCKQILTSDLNGYFNIVTTRYKNMYNVANFYIRNCMTGIKKYPDERTCNETEVLADIFNNIRLLNDIKINNYTKKHPECTRNDAVVALKGKLFQYPTKKAWFLGKYLLDGIMKATGNPDYYNLPAQVNQNAIYDCVEAWQSYFKALSSYKMNPSKFNGRPRIPKYKKGNKTTAAFTNINCKITKNENGKYFLEFPKINVPGYNKRKQKLCIGKLGNNLAIQEVKVKPEFGKYNVQICYTVEEASMSGDVLCGADLGVDNLITLLDNNGDRPLIVDGKKIKSINRYFNKRIACLTSRLNKEQPGQITSKQIQKLYLKRKNVIKNYMIHVAIQVINYCIKHNIKTLVIGENTGWKQDANMDAKSNQNFCYIPHGMLKSQIRYRCEKLGIKVIFREESYTSKASLLDFDEIPNYGDKNIHTFSGIRKKRGLYVSKDGCLINADVNAAGNVLHKEIPNAFKTITNYQNPITIRI